MIYYKLTKREIYKKVVFPVLSQGEDGVITTQTLYYADKIGFLPDKFYHYCLNPLSLCFDPARKYKRREERNENLALIIAFLADKFGDISRFEPELSTLLNKRKLGYVWPAETRDMRGFRAFCEKYPYSHKNFFNSRELLLPFRQRLILFCAVHNLMAVFLVLDVLGKIYGKIRNRR